MSASESGAEPGARGLPRLPPGRHGLPREFVVANQLDRLAAGTMRTVVEHGYAKTTVIKISAAAGVSRRTFYSFYKGKQEAVFDAYARVSDFLIEVTAEAGAGRRGWPAAVRAELGALLEAFAANPDLARFALIAPPAAGSQLADVYAGFLERLLAGLVEDRPKSARRPSAGTEHGVVGGLAALIVEEVEAGRGEQLPQLLPDLLELVLTPYLGRERAIKEARRQGG